MGKRSITLFADDYYVGDEFRSRYQLQDLLKKFGILLDVLQSMQLQVSLQKSFVLIAVAGTKARYLLHHIIKRDRHGMYSDMPRSDGTTSQLPVIGPPLITWVLP